MEGRHQELYKQQGLIYKLFPQTAFSPHMILQGRITKAPGRGWGFQEALESVLLAVTGGPGESETICN